MTQHTPVLVGISHLEQRFTDFESAKEPVQLMIEAVNAAAEDAGSKALLDAGSVRVIRGIWPYQDPARAIAQAIGSPNAETVLSPYGGNFVQTVLNQSALDIQSGQHDIIILTGAECGNTQAKAAKAGQDLGWAELPGTPDRLIGADKDMRHEAEIAIRLGRPIQIYPIMETALRHASGLGVDAHMEHISKLWAGFSDVAASNPNAWIREAKSAEEIRTISDSNRPVSFPYPKLMNSNNNVDQAAALILVSEEKAKALGIAKDKWIYPWAGTDAQDHYYFSNRDNFHSSPAIRLAGGKCLELTGSTPDNIDMIDVYSCFPCRCANRLSRAWFRHEPPSHRYRWADLCRRPIEQLRHALHRSHGPTAQRQPRQTRYDHRQRWIHYQARVRHLFYGSPRTAIPACRFARSGRCHIETGRGNRAPRRWHRRGLQCDVWSSRGLQGLRGRSSRRWPSCLGHLGRPRSAAKHDKGGILRPPG